MNITEKILAKAAGVSRVEPGQILDVPVDAAFTHEKLGPLFFSKFREMGLSIWDRDRAIVFVDHGTPPSKVMDADLITDTIRFANEYGLKLYNSEGISHQLMPEKGISCPEGLCQDGLPHHDARRAGRFCDRDRLDGDGLVFNKGASG